MKAIVTKDTIQPLAYGIIIKNIRKKKGLTQKELAHILGMDKTTISAYEREKITPPTDIFFYICNICDVEISFKIYSRTYTVKELSREF